MSDLYIRTGTPKRVRARQVVGGYDYIPIKQLENAPKWWCITHMQPIWVTDNHYGLWDGKCDKRPMVVIDND